MKKTNSENRDSLTIVPNRNTGLYGIKEGNVWIIPPVYEAILNGTLHRDSQMWVKKEGKYGYLDLASGREQIPREYGFPIYFSSDGHAEAWKNYKVGIINTRNEAVTYTLGTTYSII